MAGNPFPAHPQFCQIQQNSARGEGLIYNIPAVDFQMVEKNGTGQPSNEFFSRVSSRHCSQTPDSSNSIRLTRRRNFQLRCFQILAPAAAVCNLVGGKMRILGDLEIARGRAKLHGQTFDNMPSYVLYGESGL
jgi:hypothetical protein